MLIVLKTIVLTLNYSPYSITIKLLTILFLNFTINNEVALTKLFIILQFHFKKLNSDCILKKFINLEKK